MRSLIELFIFLQTLQSDLGELRPWHFNLCLREGAIGKPPLYPLLSFFLFVTQNVNVLAFNYEFIQ